MIRTNIKMRVTPEQLRRVQEICFSNGIEWADTRDNYIKHNMFIGIYLEHKTLWGVLSIAMLNDIEYKEIDADLFIRTNGTCKETYLTKYTSQPKDLESALKKIENLHIALNKKVAKNKNQKEEINLLLKQKENYKQLQYDYESLRLQSNKKMKDVQNDFMNIVDDLNKTIDLLEDRIKEKETIIKYLEGKLK